MIQAESELRSEGIRISQMVYGTGKDKNSRRFHSGMTTNDRDSVYSNCCVALIVWFFKSLRSVVKGEMRGFFAALRMTN